MRTLENKNLRLRFQVRNFVTLKGLDSVCGYQEKADKLLHTKIKIILQATIVMLT